jgi:flavin-dependent dehydrogenase
VLLAAGGWRAEVALPGGIALSREAFDAAMVREAIDAGADFLPRTEARLGFCEGPGRQLELRQSERCATVTGRVILAADGLGGKLLAAEPDCQPRQRRASRIGAAIQIEDDSTHYPAGTIFMACGDDGYVGLVRLEDGRLNVATALDFEAVRRQRGVAAAVAVSLSAAGLPVPAKIAQLSWRGTPALTQRLTFPAAERLFVIGDAAGYVEPFTGDGIAGAIECGLGVAPFTVRAIDSWQSRLAHEWVRWHCRQIQHRQRLCHVVAGVLRHPALVQAAVALVARLPALAVPVVRALNASTKEGCLHR